MPSLRSDMPFGVLSLDGLFITRFMMVNNRAGDVIVGRPSTQVMLPPEDSFFEAEIEARLTCRPKRALFIHEDQVSGFREAVGPSVRRAVAALLKVTSRFQLECLQPSRVQWSYTDPLTGQLLQAFSSIKLFHHLHPMSASQPCL